MTRRYDGQPTKDCRRGGQTADEYLKLVVFGADGHEVVAMFVQGSVTYDQESATFIAVAEDGRTAGELFVDETVGYDESADAFVIRTA
jgi:hypothetical protein